MKNYLKGSFIAATALMCVVGMGTKADAALIIDFDNIVFDGGTVTQSGGNWIGTNVIFDSIFLKDTTLVDPIAGVQCGATNTGTAAATPAETCKLNFNTATNTFTVTAPSGLYAIGTDLLPYSADRGGLVVAAGSTVLTGSFTSFGGIGGVVFGASGVDTKNAALLQFFGLSANTNFTFANTEIFMGPNGVVTEADLTNMAQVPEPMSMALLGLGLVGVISRRRRAQ
jgi:PEP-CTERM motif-containing protein